ncbi:hypothetical protein VP01_6428g2, partial [Puccinia sorghi]
EENSPQVSSEDEGGEGGIAAKVAKDPDGYCELQSHVPEPNTFMGKQFY